MDEIRMVREAYGEPAPPTLREMTRARALFTDEAPPRRRRWRLKAGIGLVAVGAAASVAIALTGPGGGGGTPGAPHAQVDLDREAVLAAASKAEQVPAGKYWYSDHITGQSYIMRTKAGTYAIAGAHTEFFRWAGARKGMGEGFWGRDLPARPLTAADEAVWKRDGSPKSFRVWSNDHYYTYTAAATDWKVDRPSAIGGGTFGRLTTRQVHDLPSDPAALAARFLKPKPGDAKGLALNTPRLKVLTVGTLLEELPVSPAVRAGLMRALARQPGIHPIGKVTDLLGRTGVALASDPVRNTATGEFGAPKAEQGTFSSRAVIVFDQKTGALLGQHEELVEPGGPYRAQRPGFVINYVLVRGLGWAESQPKPPARLPF
ncbi:CU044_5270 family protein [Actinomadura macrotermitis]|uniref:CU044_5270 family protein n=1 Tax=Actinomadura macrotermitis TaxID=2585200 RepID=A0A7K0BUV4_9ACTN|nr:CU044_5270 family protein [Actinomadura macrotermitis]MQY04923.1 hypothetical protein [Actinomadura macrotermitis]